MLPVAAYGALLSLIVHLGFLRAFAPSLTWRPEELLCSALGLLSSFLIVFTPLYLVAGLDASPRVKRAAWVLIPLGFLACAGLDAVCYKLFKTHADYFVVSNAAYALWTGEVDPVRIPAGRLALFAGFAAALTAVLAVSAHKTERWRLRARRSRAADAALLALWALFFFQGEAVSALRKRGYRAWGIFPFERTSLFEMWGGGSAEGGFSSNVEFARFARLQEARRGLPSAISAARRPNIVFIHAESLRSDAFTPAIMPLLSARVARCEKEGRCRALRGHYTTGNNTSMGIFGMLDGLSGFFYYPFKRANASPIPLTVLKRLGYRGSLYSVADMHYDGIRELLFDRDMDYVYPAFSGRHSHNIRMDELDLKMFDRYRQDLRRTDFKAGPRFDYVMSYMTHYNYYYTDRCAKHRPVVDLPFEFKNGDFTLTEDQYRRLHNRFLNGACEVDLLVDGVIRELQALRQWDNTILVVFGDHGEEFGEKGRVGHGNGHNDEQVRTTFVAFFPTPVPEIAYRTTSHSDVMPTLFKYMGVAVDGPSFMNGKDLFAYERARDFAVVSDGTYDTQTRYRHSVVAADMKVVFENFGRLDPDRAVVYGPGDDEKLVFDRPRATELLRRALDNKSAFAGTHSP